MHRSAPVTILIFSLIFIVHIVTGIETLIAITVATKVSIKIKDVAKLQFSKLWPYIVSLSYRTKTSGIHSAVNLQ